MILPGPPAAGDNPANPPAVRQAPPWRWLVLFLLLAAFFYWFDNLDWFQKTVVMPLAELFAWLCQLILSVLGMAIARRGNVLTTAGGSLVFAGSCTGTFVFFLFAAAVIPFPVGWRRRLTGLLAGLAAIFLLNLLRGLMITGITSRFPHLLWSLHVVAGQLIVIAGMMAVFIRWAGRRSHAAGRILSGPRRILAARLGLFCSGYLILHLFYFQFFITSPLAGWLREMIIHHAAWLLSWFGAASARGPSLVTDSCAIALTPGCLHSPVVVISGAIVLAWRWKWWIRLAALAAGFLPAFYLFNLIRTLFIVLTEPATRGSGHNFIHTFFGSLVLTGFLIMAAGWWWCRKIEADSWRPFLLRLASSLALAIPLAFLASMAGERVLFPWLGELLAHPRGLPPDGELAARRLGGAMLFVWILFTGLLPGIRTSVRLKKAAAGILILEVFHAGVLGVLILLELDPHIRLLKLTALAAPAGLLLIMFPGHRPWRMAAAPEQPVSHRPGPPPASG